MRKSSVLSFRVSAEQKALINSACQHKGITESALVRRLIEMAVETAGDIPPWRRSMQRGSLAVVESLCGCGLRTVC